MSVQVQDPGLGSRRQFERHPLVHDGRRAGLH
jgi:hypothetical protein